MWTEVEELLEPSRASLGGAASALGADPRVGDLVGRQAEAPWVVLVGFPEDRGVVRNGGRPGAAKGPDALRTQLRKMTPPAGGARFAKVCEHTLDLGNIRTQGSLAASQAALGKVVGHALGTGVLPIVLGGGHETAYGSFLGFVGTGLSVGILNLDAHADVRPLKGGKGHSGSPFRQALEHPSGCCASYSVLGLEPSAVAHEHAGYIRRHGGSLRWAVESGSMAIERAFADLAAEPGIFATLCLDAVDAASAPGVSAPSVSGVDAKLAEHYAYRAGSSPNLRCFEVAELNPDFDRDHMTARLGAKLVWNLLRGFAEAEF